MKKTISILLALLFLLSACVPKAPTGDMRPPAVEPDNPVTAEPPPPGVLAMYAPVLESWGKAIGEMRSGIEAPFICQFIPFEFWQAHYAYYDIDRNGVPELLIAAFYNLSYFHMIDVFTIHDDAPVRLFEGIEDGGFWSRNRLDFSFDGASLIVEGSSGAAYTTTDFYRVAENGYQVELLEGLATYDPEGQGGYAPHYRLPDGSYEITAYFHEVMEKYYGRKYLTRNETYDYSSDFHTQIEWKPIVQAVPLVGIVTIPIEGVEYRPNSMPELLEVAIAEESILSDHTLADGTGLCWYLDGTSAACAYRKPGGAWVRFIAADSAYRDGFGFESYTDLFGHSGFTVTAPRGADYYAHDYYYLDATGTPQLLFEGNYLDKIGDFNGDGENELLHFYHGGRDALYHYLQDGETYTFDVIAELMARFPGWKNVCANPIILPDNTLQVTYSVGDTEYAIQIHLFAEDMLLSETTMSPDISSNETENSNIHPGNELSRLHDVDPEEDFFEEIPPIR